MSPASRDPRAADGESTQHPGDRPALEPGELVEIYDDVAPQLERFDRVNQVLTGRFRRRQFGSADGRVLDVACGTGENFPHLPSGVELVGVDLSPRMLAGANRRARDLDLEVDLSRMDAAALEFADGSFDTVISSLSTCTFPDPIGALSEMARVCRPDGRVLLLEHGRASVGPIARVQDWRADAHFEGTGCRWNQEPLELVSEAPLEVHEVRRGLFGILTALEAVPTLTDSDGERAHDGRLRDGSS